VVSRQINSLPLDRGTHRPSHQKPECHFEISRPTRQRLGTPFQGITPSDESSGLKGRRDIEPPQWTAELKKRTIEIIQPDSEAFLKTLHWPDNTWQWD
jgi:hypothetical protein